MIDTETSELPYDRPPTSGDDSGRRRVSRDLPDGGAALRAIAADLGQPLDVVALAAWALVLAAYSRSWSVGVGLAHGEAIGSVRVEAHPPDTFAELARHISAAVPPADADLHPVAAGFVLDFGSHDPDGFPPTMALAVGLDSAAEPISLTASYLPALFDRSTAVRVLDHLATALDEVGRSGGGVALGEVNILPAAELAQLAAWNATTVSYPSGETLASLFSAAVVRHSDRTALQADGRQLTYRDLDELVERVTRRLSAAGIGRGDLVGVLAERSVELVAALHGVVRAGAGYVPLDPEYPAERIGYMVGETGMRVVLGQDRFRGLLGDASVAWVDLDALLGSGAQAKEGPAPDPAQPADVAYVIYTSGSTGRPKGVANSHAGVVNRLRWMQDRFGLGPGNVVLQKTPFSFDVSVWEFFWPLQVGAKLVVAEPGGHRDPGYLVETIRRQAVDTLHFVPSMLRLFLEHPAVGECTSLRRVICSGEALTRDLVDRCFTVLPGAELHNLYGPTEAAIDVTAWQCRPDDPQPVVPIGAPIANTTIHILDERLRPVPIGIPGELYIGGVQVALGYVNRPDLTAERFIADPFDPRGRLYRTGDLARWLPSGQVDFLGRLDHQVKIRGQRVELGEIEAVLGEHPAVLEAVVTVANAGSDPSLAAHVMWSRQSASESVLRSFLADRLPAHMIPARFVAHDALPLTSSGKVDRKLLVGLDADSRPLRRTTGGANDLERFLLDIWRTVLDRPDVGRDDRVFDLGASSLQAAAFVNRLQRELDEFIYVVTVFTAPTVAEYAAFLAREYPAAVARRFGEAIASRPAAGDTRVDEGALRRMADIVPTFGPYPSWGAGERNPPAVFILAPPRSGTTLLRVMLAGHPRVFAAPELQLLGFDTLAQRRAALQGRYSPWREGTIRALMELEGCDADAATESMEAHERSGLSSKEFYRWLQHRAGDRMVVDKSPTYALDLEVLRNAERGFDAPLYIHLVREPLAMSRSFESYHMDQILFLREHQWPGRTLGELVWTRSHRNILELAEDVPPERILRLRFEDLVSDPRPAMSEVASFLGLEFDERLIQPYEHLETKMVDGLHPQSTPMGDTRLLERDRIDPAVATRWADPDGKGGLGEPTLRLAGRFGYGGSADSSAAGGRRQLADITRQRRLARRSGG